MAQRGSAPDRPVSERTKKTPAKRYRADKAPATAWGATCAPERKSFHKPPSIAGQRNDSGVTRLPAEATTSGACALRSPNATRRANSAANASNASAVHCNPFNLVIPIRDLFTQFDSRNSGRISRILSPACAGPVICLCDQPGTTARCRASGRAAPAVPYLILLQVGFALHGTSRSRTVVSYTAVSPLLRHALQRAGAV